MRGAGRILAGLLALAVVGAACGGERAGGEPESGIEGTVFLSPACPVEEAAARCPPQPVAANIVVTGVGSGQIVKRAQSSSNGHFRIPLRPGRYLVAATPLRGGFGGSVPVTATVTGGDFSQLDVVVDSGIR